MQAKKKARAQVHNNSRDIRWPTVEWPLAPAPEPGLGPVLLAPTGACRDTTDSAAADVFAARI